MLMGGKDMLTLKKVSSTLVFRTPLSRLIFTGSEEAFPEADILPLAPASFLLRNLPQSTSQQWGFRFSKDEL
jgi:hypothetical protein